MQKCCSLGMQPVVHTTLSEQQCMAHFTKGEEKISPLAKSYIYRRYCIKNINLHPNCAGNWSGNLNYWTGGIQSCKGMWGFCTGTTFERLTTDLLWATNQSTAAPLKENCMHLKVNRNSVNATTLSAKACNSKFIYACQVRTLFF